MILEQYYLGCLAHASYLVGDERSGVGVVVDPQRDVEQYLEDADRRGLRIAHVFLTHFHADFVAGHLELRERTGAAIHLGCRAQGRLRVRRRWATATSLELGGVRLQVLETPGHSPESISILVFDPAHGDDRPYAVLTGDTLFIGDVGRPDLRASLGWSADELASLLYDSRPPQARQAPRRDARLPGARRRLAVRQAPVDRHGLDDRRAAGLQLRDAADEPRAVRRDRHRRPAGRARLLHLRRRAERQRAPDARRRRSSAS